MELFTLCSCLANITYSVFQSNISPISQTIDSNIFVDITHKYDDQSLINEYDKLLIINSTYIIGSKGHIYFSSFQDIVHRSSLPSIPKDCKYSCGNYVNLISFSNQTQSLLVCGTNSNSPECYVFKCQSGTMIETCDHLSFSMKLKPKDLPIPGNSMYKFMSVDTENYIYLAGKLRFGSSYRNSILKVKRNTMEIQVSSFGEVLKQGMTFLFGFTNNHSVYHILFDFNTRKTYLTQILDSDDGAEIKSKRPNKKKYFTTLKNVVLQCTRKDILFLRATSAVFLNEHLYVAFNTLRNNIPGLAICTFGISQINEIFNQKDIIKNDSLVTSSLYHDRYLLRNEAFFTLTRNAFDFYYIAGQTISKNLSLLFFASHSNRISKVIHNVSSNDMHWLDEITTKKSFEQITNMQFSLEKGVVMTKHHVYTFSVQRCKTFPTCGSCIHSKDPMCRWDSISKQCVTTDSIESSAFFANYSSCSNANDVITELKCSCDGDCRSCPVFTDPQASTSTPKSSFFTDLNLTWALLILIGVLIGFAAGTCINFFVCGRCSRFQEIPDGPTACSYISHDMTGDVLEKQYSSINSLSNASNPSPESPRSQIFRHVVNTTRNTFPRRCDVPIPLPPKKNCLRETDFDHPETMPFMTGFATELPNGFNSTNSPRVSRERSVTPLRNYHNMPMGSNFYPNHPNHRDILY